MVLCVHTRPASQGLGPYKVAGQRCRNEATRAAAAAPCAAGPGAAKSALGLRCRNRDVTQHESAEPKRPKAGTDPDEARVRVAGLARAWAAIRLQAVHNAKQG